MVKHSQLFIDSLIHPKKLAAYRMLPIGKTIQYVFILITLIMIFSFTQFVMGMSTTDTNYYNIEGLTQYVEDIQWLLYPFALLILLMTTTALIFLQISVYAFIGVGILKLNKRRGEYRHVWRSSALAITWTTLLSILFSFIPIQDVLETIIGIVITIIILFIASTKYPKMPKK